LQKFPDDIRFLSVRGFDTPAARDPFPWAIDRGKGFAKLAESEMSMSLKNSAPHPALSFHEGGVVVCVKRISLNPFEPTGFCAEFRFTLSSKLGAEP
jgi:hypothetical protein